MLFPESTKCFAEKIIPIRLDVFSRLVWWIIGNVLPLQAEFKS